MCNITALKSDFRLVEGSRYSEETTLSAIDETLWSQVECT